MSDERQSECHVCAPYVIRCAHLVDVGHVELVATGEGHWSCESCHPEPCTSCENDEIAGHVFLVNVIPLEAISRVCSECKAVWVHAELGQQTQFDDEAPALEEFQAQAAALLGRGA